MAETPAPEETLPSIDERLFEMPQSSLVGYPKRSLRRELPEPSIDLVPAPGVVRRRMVSATELAYRRRDKLRTLQRNPLTPDGRALPRTAIDARWEREQLVGRTVELTPEWRNLDDPSNPFALDPTFGFGRLQLRIHAELFDWTHAQWHPTGTLLKGRSAAAVDRMAVALDRIAPLLTELDLELACAYDREGKRDFRLAETSLLSPMGPQQRILAVAQLDSRRSIERQVESLLRQLVRQRHPSATGEDFAVAYETLLNHYLDRYAEEPIAEHLRSSWAANPTNPGRIVPESKPEEPVLQEQLRFDPELEAMLAELDAPAEDPEHRD